MIRDDIAEFVRLAKMEDPRVQDDFWAVDDGVFCTSEETADMLVQKNGEMVKQARDGGWLVSTKQQRLT